MNANSEHNKIVRLLEKGEACLVKLEKTIEPKKLKKGICYYSRFRVRLPAKFIKTHGLTEGDLLYVVPQKLLDKKKGEISERKDVIRIKSVDSVKVRVKLYRKIIEGREYWYVQGLPAKLPAGIILIGPEK